MVFVWSVIGCYRLSTWFLEVWPVFIGIPVLVWLYPRFRLTNLVYSLIAVYALIIMIGSHYTYARMPAFTWLQEALSLDRNYYDRLAHIVQGLVPALLTREVLARFTPLQKGRLSTVLVLSVCLALSALWELLEFAVVRLARLPAGVFLGGDPWDTQWDMTFCLIGAVGGLLLLARTHDRAMEAEESRVRSVSV